MTEPRIFTRLNEYLANLPQMEPRDIDYRYLSKTEQLSRLSSKPKFKVGSMIVQRGKVFGQGCNSCKTHPFQARWNQFSQCLHAEMAALLDAQKRSDFDPNRSTIYVTRYQRQGTLGCSYPCKSCWAALSHVGIRHVVCYNQWDIPVRIKIH